MDTRVCKFMCTPVGFEKVVCVCVGVFMVRSCNCVCWWSELPPKRRTGFTVYGLEHSSWFARFCSTLSLFVRRVRPKKTRCWDGCSTGFLRPIGEHVVVCVLVYLAWLWVSPNAPGWPKMGRRCVSVYVSGQKMGRRCACSCACACHDCAGDWM